MQKKTEKQKEKHLKEIKVIWKKLSDAFERYVLWSGSDFSNQVSRRRISCKNNSLRDNFIFIRKSHFSCIQHPIRHHKVQLKTSEASPANRRSLNFCAFSASVDLWL